MSADELDVKSLGIIKHDIESLAQNILLSKWINFSEILIEIQ